MANKIYLIIFFDIRVNKIDVFTVLSLLSIKTTSLILGGFKPWYSDRIRIRPHFKKPDPDPKPWLYSSSGSLQHWIYPHGFYIRCLLISLCAHMDPTRNFDLLKAFGYVDRIFKSDFFLGKTSYSIPSQHALSYHLI